MDELDPRTRSSLLGVAARIALHGGNQRRAFDAFLEAATLAAPWDADRAAELRADAVAAAVQLGGDAPAIAAAELEAHGDLDDPWTAVVVSQARGSAASMSGAAGARALIERAVELSETASPESAQQLYLTGRSNFMLGRNNAAAELARQALAQARRDDASRIVVETLRLLAGAEFDRGHWRDAYAAAAEAVELAEEIGLPRDACAALGILAEVDAGAGNGLACAEHAARAIELGAEFDLGFYRARAERASGQLALATGRHEEAAAELERVWKEQLETGSQEWSVTPVFDLIEALVRLGRREEARDVLVRARAELPPESPVEQGIFDRCAALLEEDFEPLFDRALAAHALEEFVDEFPFEHARVRLAYGTRLRRAGRRREARAQLEAAHEAFQEIGAGAWAEQASAELRASGARRRAGDVSREHLTPREQQIAVAVAEGASNREVAAQLFLTPKTVEYHLTRVYRKLGVRTRVELVRLLGPSVGVAARDCARAPRRGASRRRRRVGRPRSDACRRRASPCRTGRRRRASRRRSPLLARAFLVDLCAALLHPHVRAARAAAERALAAPRHLERLGRPPRRGRAALEHVVVAREVAGVVVRDRLVAARSA